MTDNKQTNESVQTPREIIMAGLGKRKAKEAAFKFFGMSAVGFGIFALLVMFTSITYNGHSAFWQTHIKLDIVFDEAQFSTDVPMVDAVNQADFGAMVKASLRAQFPEIKGRKQKRQLYKLASNGASYILRDLVQEKPSLIGTTQSVWLPTSGDIDMFVKGHLTAEGLESERRIKDNQVQWVDTLKNSGALEKKFNIAFFTSGDSRDPELSGIAGAAKGSFYTLLITFLLSFPIGIAAAIYLEEFAPKNRISDFIEVNINNLAAVPSIVFGLLGLAIFLNWFELPRSAPLVGGFVLTLMTLPTIIISSRAALKSVPPSIREAALGVGASPLQAMYYHVLPLAMPGMLTGAILGMAQALGESAPLLMIGMVAFIVDIPGSPMDPSTVLPVQIFLWADSPERAFVERTSAAILVLLAFLVCMNGIAVLLRKRFERNW